jgi:hypothetical protein
MPVNAEAQGAPISNGGASTPEAPPPPAGPDQGAPDTLTDSQRADILTAVDRANAAWTTATLTLNGSPLSSSVAGQALRDDLAEVDRLRRQGHTTKNVNSSFVVLDVTLDAPGHAVVHTRESWSVDTYDRSSGQLLQRGPSANYDEAYVVESQSGTWIVTANEIHQ